MTLYWLADATREALKAVAGQAKAIPVITGRVTVLNCIEGVKNGVYASGIKNGPDNVRRDNFRSCSFHLSEIMLFAPGLH